MFLATLVSLALATAPALLQAPCTDAPEPQPDFAWLGCAIAPIGDLDGDGAGDFLVGAPREGAPGGQNHPSIRAVSGKHGTILFTRVGPWGFGSSIAPLGDLDGDGKVDFASGTWANLVLVCSGADGATLRTIAEPQFDVQPPGAVHSVVASPGDLDGDGHADLVVSWVGYAGEGRADGRVRVYSGASGELLYAVEGLKGRLVPRVYALPDLDGDGAGEWGYTFPLGGYRDPAVVKVVSGKDGSERFTLTPQRPTCAQGLALDSMGDITGDGIPDLALGASEPNGWGVADEPGAWTEPSGEIEILSGRDGNRVRRHTEEGASLLYGHAILGGADLDGDGVPDYLVTECEDVHQKVDSGKAWLYSGKDHNLLRTTIGATWGRFGATASWVGDVDGDGVSDYAIGCMIDYVGSIEPGKVIVYSGRTGKELYRLPR